MQHALKSFAPGGAEKTARLRETTAGQARALHTEVGDIRECVVEPVGEVRRADHQRQFDDLPLVVILPQLLERTGADSRRAAGDALGVEDGGLLLLIKQRAALIEVQRLDLLVGDADSLRRSDVGAGSILAAVGHRRFQVGELLVAWFDGAFIHDSTVKRQECLQHIWPMGHRGEEIRHLADFLCERVVGLVHLGRRFFFRQRIHNRHESPPRRNRFLVCDLPVYTPWRRSGTGASRLGGRRDTQLLFAELFR